MSGVELVSAESDTFALARFSYLQAAIFRVIVRDRTGIERVGWLGVGSWWAGVISDQAKIIWDS
jgi:hypothetical protein